MTELDGLFKVHEATDAAIVASATIPKRNIALARDTNQLLIRKEDNTLLRVMTGDRLERSNPTATGTVTADAFRVSPTAGVTSSAVGTFFWDAADHTVSLALENGSELQLGREAVQWCKNSTDTAIPNGSLVYISGATGDNPTISLASATVGAATGDAIGMATQTIPGNGEGMVATNISFVRGLDTSATPPGTRLWLSTTPGAWSSGTPARPNYRVQVGFVLRQHANQGIVLLWIVRYPAAAELADVDATGATTGQGLVYGADGVWRPGALLALGELSGTAYRGDRGKIAYDHSQIALANPHGTTAAQVGAAAASHTHAAGDVTSGTFAEARIPALPTSRITGLDTALAGKSDVGHTHSYLPINNPAFTGTLTGPALNLSGGTANAFMRFDASKNAVASSMTEVGTEILATSRDFWARTINSAYAASDSVGSGSNFAVQDAKTGCTKGWLLQLGASNDLALWRFSGSWGKLWQFLSDGSLSQNGTTRITAGGDGRFTSLRASALAAASVRAATIGTDGTLGAQDAATFRATIEAMPAPIQITGAINFNSINGGAPGIYRLEGSSYTNAPGGATSTTTYSLWQGVAGGRITQVLVDGWYGGMLHREQLGAYANSWSAWAEIWDSTVVPISLFAKSLLNDIDAPTARATLNAAVKPSVGTQAGNWTLGTSTPTGTRQTGSGTLTLPAASATYAGLSYTITATTALTLTIAGTFCYLDPNNSASYWYGTATSVALAMDGGHTSGARKQIEIYCDGVEWLVKC